MPGMKSNETMDYLVERVRSVLGDDPRVNEKAMFGGLTFLLDGHILVGCKKDGRILLSVGKAHFDEAVARPGATPMVHGGRQMTGFVWVEPDAIEDDDDLSVWVSLAYRCVSQMPADDPKKKAAARKAPAKTPKPKRARASACPHRGSHEPHPTHQVIPANAGTSVLKSRSVGGGKQRSPRSRG